MKKNLKYNIKVFWLYFQLQKRAELLERRKIFLFRFLKYYFL